MIARNRRPVRDARFVRQLRGAVSTWFSNRWHWRTRRRNRAEFDRLSGIARRLADVDLPMSAPVARVAHLLERLGFSAVLEYGFGMGEAVAVAAAHEAARVEPLAFALGSYTDSEILGQGGDNVRAAVAARNELIAVVRDIVIREPKRQPD